MENNAFKSGFVTLIGRPNVGKSTLMNCIIGQKIAITSNKPQTTRNRIQTVYTSEEGQIVFLDTPGIHKAKNKLGDYMVTVAEKTLSEVDVILWLVEPSNFIGAGERHIIEQLKKGKTPVILVINKIDTVKKEQLLEYIDTYRKEYDFAEIASLILHFNLFYIKLAALQKICVFTFAVRTYSSIFNSWICLFTILAISNRFNRLYYKLCIFKKISPCNSPFPAVRKICIYNR